MSENNQTKSGRGGPRKGAGRKPGSATKKTRAIADRAAEEGVTPLDVMLQAMRKMHGDGDFIGAANIAKYAAPYCHARLAAIDHTTNGKDMGQTSGVLMVPGVMNEAQWEAAAQALPQ
jgi:hypothetical protein